MNLDASVGVMWGIVVLFVFLVWRKKGLAGVREALGATWDLVKIVIQIIPFALLAATLATQMIPRDLIAGLIGQDTGLAGMAVAAVAGGLVPSGPFLSFPLALSLFHTGAGPGQIVAFITGWSVYAFYRVAVWELPMMGMRFTMLRLGASVILPMVAGVTAGTIFQMF